MVHGLSIIVLLATAFALGMRHALDPDHLVVVSTMVAEERRLWPAARLGLIWGIGHLIPIAVIGVPVLLLRLEIPEAMENVVDLGVGLLLVGLGARTICQLRQEGIHCHVHSHDGIMHGHFHAHRRTTEPGNGHDHCHFHPFNGLDRRGLIAFVFGMVHGLAGSSVAAVLALTAAPFVSTGVGYLLVFGFGTCVGMFTTTLCLAAPAVSAVSKVGKLHSILRGGAGLASIAVGAMMWFEIVPGLLG